MLKNTKLVRRLAWLLCLSLVIGLVPMGIWSVPSAVNAASDGTVVFSENVEASNFWSKWSKVGSLFAWTDPDYQYEGNRVLLVQAGGSATGPAFAVTPGKAYSLSYFTKLHTAPASGADLGSAQIRFYDANGTQIKGATVSAVAWDEVAWAEKTLVAVAPDNAATARLHFDTDGDPKLTYVVDAMTVTERDPEPDETVATEPDGDSQPSNNLLENGGFEDGFRYWKCSTELSVSDDKFSGAKAAQIVDDSNKSSVTVTQTVSVTPGKTYRLSAKVKFVSGKGGYIGVCNIGEATQYPTIDQSGAWADFSLTVTIPSGYTSATVEMGGFVGTVTTFLVDDVVFEEVVEGEPDPTETTGATEAPGDNPVINCGFENGLENWTVIGDGTLTNDAHSGNAAVRYVDATKTGGGYIAQKISVVPGKSYKVTAWIKHISGDNGYVGICGIGDASVYTSTGKNAEWTQVSAVVTIPEGYTVATVEIGANKSPVVTFLIDDVVVEEVIGGTPEQTETTEATTEATEPTTEVTEPAGEKVFEEKFEKYYTPEGRPASVKIPNGWTASEYSAAVACGKYDKEYDGSWNLCLFNPHAADRWLRSELIEATPGYEYIVSFMEHKYQPELAGSGGYAKIVFVDANGNFLKEYKIVAGTAKIWSQKLLYGKAPGNAAAFYVEFGLLQPSGDANYFVDDVAVYEVEASLDEPDVTNPTEPTAPTVPMEDNLVGNNDFENGLENWKVVGNASLSNDAHSGNNAALFADNSEDVAGYIAQEVPVTPGKTYMLSAWINILDGKSGYVGISGVGEASQYPSTGEARGWVQCVMYITIPEGYTTATIEIGTSRKQVATFLIDDVVFMEVEKEPTEPTETTEPTTEVTEPAGEKMFEEKFEESYTPEGRPASVKIPNGWTASEHTAAVACGKYDKGYDGSYNLCLFNPTQTDRWIRSPLQKAVPGYEYTVTFHERKYYENARGEGGYAKVVFLDADGNVLKEYEIVAGTSKVWSQQVLYSKAPKDAANFYVELGMRKPNGDVNYCVDDLAIYELKADLSDPDVTNPTEPTVPFDPMKPIDEKFEDFMDFDDANAGPAGWTSNDDNGFDYAPMIGLVNNALSVDGYYLRLQKAGKWLIQTPSFPVEIGYEYTAAFLARKLADNDNFAGALEINFVNSRGKIIASEKIPVGKTYGAWTEESLSAVAPVGALKAYLVFSLEYSNGRIEGDYAIDNFTVTRSEKPAFDYTPDPGSMEPTEFSVIYTEKFEKYYNPAGSAASVKVPVDWTLSEFTAAIGNAKYDNYDGTFNLVVQGKRDMWAKSPMIKASEGNYYYACFVEKKLYGYREGSGGYGKVVFLDANDKVLKEYREVIGTSEIWTDMEIGGQAPAGTAKLYVEFGLVSAKGDPIYSIDNLEILEGKANLPGSEPSDPGTTNPTEPAGPDDNAPTGDHVAIMTAYTVLTAVMILAVLVLQKRKLF